MNLIPFDGKPRHPRLLREDISADTFNYRLRGGLVDKLLRIILVVDVVSHPHELPAVVAAAQQDHGHAQDLGRRYPLEVWRVSLEDELVYPDWDRPDEEGVELLVVLGPEHQRQPALCDLSSWQRLRYAYEVAEPT